MTVVLMSTAWRRREGLLLLLVLLLFLGDMGMVLAAAAVDAMTFIVLFNVLSAMTSLVFSRAAPWSQDPHLPALHFNFTIQKS